MAGIRLSAESGDFAWNDLAELADDLRRIGGIDNVDILHPFRVQWPLEDYSTLDLALDQDSDATIRTAIVAAVVGWLTRQRRSPRGPARRVRVYSAGRRQLAEVKLQAADTEPLVEIDNAGE